MKKPSPWFRDLTIGGRAAGRRADVYLAARFPDWSRTELAEWIRRGAVISAQRKLKPSSKLRLGEHLRLHIPGIAPGSPPPPLPPILHEDERLLVLDKPPHLLCHPAGDRWTYAVVGLARRARPDHDVDLAHRLDRDTSGVLVMTKDREANVAVKASLVDRQVRKVYQAVVHGTIPWDDQEVHAPVGDQTASEIRLRMGVVADGKAAHTTVRVLRRVPTAPHGLTQVEIDLHTGRTHQIRVHLEHLGFPLVGDRIYGQPDAVFLQSLSKGCDAMVRAAVGFPRQALHCATMILPHPDGHELTLHAPFAADLQALVDGTPPSWPDPPPEE